MSVLVSEHAIAEYELSEYEPVALVEERQTPNEKLFPSVLSVVPVLLLLEASFAIAGVASYHIGMLLITRAHLIH